MTLLHAVVSDPALALALPGRGSAGELAAVPSDYYYYSCMGTHTPFTQNTPHTPPSFCSAPSPLPLLYKQTRPW